MAVDVHRFAGFELDRERRSLRLEGRELALQPRVLDLLLYLVDNRDRVVSKHELLEALWPGVIVTEGSLQRAVSLARTALQQGGIGHVLRNYARRGYRFDWDSSSAPGDVPQAASLACEAAEELVANAQWATAADRFAEADRASPLAAEGLERWAMAAQCAGRLADAVAPLERAAVAFASRDEREAAARVLIGLARIQLESLEVAVAQGCLRRAAHLLSGVTPGVQHGFLAWMMARLCLSTGDLTAALDHASAAREIGRRLGNPDIESMGLLLVGMGLQARGDTPAGLELQDEAAAAVMAGHVSPLVGGLVYCGLIASCANCGDWHRAGQWTETFSRWCERHSIETFTAACEIHRAEVLVSAGRLHEARAVIAQIDPLLRSGAPWALGDAARLLGDVHLALGEDEAAGQCYQSAHAKGWDPYPGFAIQLHRRGRSVEAVLGLRRAAEHASYSAGERKARYLAHAAQIAAQSGQLDEARSLIAALDGAPRSWESGAVAGQVDIARAELHWADGLSEEATREFRRGIETLRRKQALLDAACARLRFAELLAGRGEEAASQLELRTAEAQFEESGAAGCLAQCRSLRDRLGAGRSGRRRG